MKEKMVEETQWRRMCQAENKGRRADILDNERSSTSTGRVRGAGSRIGGRAMKRERTRSPSRERSRYRERSRSMGKRRCDGNTEGEYVEEADEKFWVKNERIESSRMERGRVSIEKERELRFNEEKNEIP